MENPARLQAMSDSHSDSLVIVGRFQPELYHQLKKQFKKIVYTGINELNVPCDQVLCNGFDLAQEASRYMNRLGHTHIGYIGIGTEPEGRYLGFMESVRKLKLASEPAYIVNIPELSLDGGYTGMKTLLERAPRVTAVNCANDMVAISALQVCNEHGVRVPKELSLMGINDIPNVRYVQPKLTTMHVPMEEKGKLAVRVLIDRFDHGHDLPIKVSLPFYVVERESCVPPRSQ